MQLRNSHRGRAPRNDPPDYPLTTWLTMCCTLSTSMMYGTQLAPAVPHDAFPSVFAPLLGYSAKQRPESRLLEASTHSHRYVWRFEIIVVDDGPLAARRIIDSTRVTTP